MSRRFTRRAFLALGAASLAAPAFAADELVFPLHLAYARIGPGGFVPIRVSEQERWTSLELRTGRLIERLEPLQPGSMLGQTAPELDGGASCALAARTMAAEAGFSHVVLYATHDGQKSKADWVNLCFSSLRTSGKARALGEAHLLAITGGAPLASATADAATRSWLNPFDNHRNPERETLDQLLAALERRLQLLARPAFERAQSIAD